MSYLYKSFINFLIYAFPIVMALGFIFLKIAPDSSTLSAMSFAIGCPTGYALSCFFPIIKYTKDEVSEQ